MTMSIKSDAPSVLLIAEYQILLAMELKSELEAVGYRVLDLAARNEEALAIAREVEPDLALVNISLANGDDGVLLARELKTLGIPVLFISGQPDKARSAKAVGLALIPKPYTPSDIVEVVDYLFRHARGDESRPAPSRLELFEAAPS
jgi:DNA-binding response OmpR family regulator